MNKFGKRIMEFILAHSLAVVIVTGAITLAALFLLPKIKFDNSVDAFFEHKSRSYTAFQEWKAQFGSDDVVMVAFSDRDIFTAENLLLIQRLSSALENIRYVDKVTSLTTVNDVIGSENDFIVRRFIEEVPRQPEALADLKERALANPLYLKNVISSDGATAALIIELEHRTGKNDRYKKEVIENVNKTLAEHFPAGKKYYVSGFTAIEYYYARFMQDDLLRFLPLIFAIVVLVLIFSFRGIVGLLLPLSVVLLSLVWTMAFLYLCGYSINNVTTVIPPIMLSITLLEGIHFVWELIHKKGGANPSKEEATALIAETMQHLFVPCFMTNITTVIGFFALLVTAVPPIRQLGWVSGIGVFFAFILTFTFLPAIIKQFDLLRYLSTQKLESRIKKAFDAGLLKLTALSDTYKVPILVVSCIVAAVSVWFTLKIKTETSVLEYFRKDSAIYRATDFIEKNVSGVHLLNISLRAETVDSFKEPAFLKKVEELQAYLSKIPEVDKTTSIVDYLKEINKSFHNEDQAFYALPDSREMVSQYLLLYNADDLADYANADWDWTTVRVRLKEHSTARLKKVIATINRYLDGEFKDLSIHETLGQTVLEVNSNEAVTSGQVQSLSFAMLLIFGMMFIDFRSFSLGTISILPNVFPLLLNFGIMGLLGIRLDSATSMISDIGIGIIVDDTIHFYHSFGEEVKRVGDYRLALYQSFAIKGSPTIITSLILMLGFGVLTFSHFVPTYYFGFLSALLIFNGLWSELLLSPALLMFFKPKFKGVS